MAMAMAMAMDLGKVFFCSISSTQTKEILHSYTTTINGNGNGNVNVNGNNSSSIESLAHLCLDHTPPFHAHYSHTAANRTYAFLIDSDLTYFTIATADTAPLALLYQIRNEFNRPTQQQQYLLDIITTITRGGGGGGPPTPAAAEEQQQSWPLSGSSSTKSPLLDRREVGMGVESSPAVSASASASAAATQLQMKKRRSSSSSSARKVWWRHVKVVMVVDLFLCVILFGIWMAVCRGFYCLS